MKKITSILLVVVMLVACLATSAFAAKSGEEVTVTFYATNNPGFVNYGAKINYDSSALTLKSISAGELSTAGFFDGYEGTGIVGFFGNDEVTGDGVLFTATFAVNEGAEAGDYSVTATLDTLSTNNAAGEEVAFGISGGSVTVDAPEAPHEHVYGDDWVYDEEGHWHECSCGEKTEYNTHSFNDWEVNEDGTEKSMGCIVCGYTVTETIEPDPTEKPEPTKKPVDPSKSPQTGDFIAFAVIAVVCAAAVVVIVSSKKSKAQK